MVGQMSGWTNFWLEKCLVGQMSGWMNVLIGQLSGLDKCVFGQTSGWTNIQFVNISLSVLRINKILKSDCIDRSCLLMLLKCELTVIFPNK